MARLLVVHHSPTSAVRSLTEAVLDGSRDDAIEGVEVVVRQALEATAEDVLAADGYLLGTPANFGYMSGALKDFFDRVFYEVINDTPGLPYALFVKAGNDGEGAVRSVERLVIGLRWKAVVPPVVVTGNVEPGDLDRCTELGATVAAGLEAGMF